MAITKRAELPSVMIVLFVVIAAVEAADLPSILSICPEGEIFDQTIKGMKGEVEGSYSLHTLRISKESEYEQIGKEIQSTSPKAIVLMGNRAIKLLKSYMQTCPEKNGNIPVVALLASQVEEAVDGLENAGGIAYETPMVTALVNFRSVFGMKIDRVGVVYRAVFENFVKQHIEYCRREKIDVKSILVGDNSNDRKSEIKKALKQLIKKDKVDVFWVPNDNKLIDPEMLNDIWIPTFAKNKIPVIVGVESLVKPDVNFGTYAVIPEPIAMGEQAAQMIFELEETGWKFTSNKIYPAISVYSVLNKHKMSTVSATKINLNDVTKILE